MFIDGVPFRGTASKSLTNLNNHAFNSVFVIHTTFTFLSNTISVCTVSQTTRDLSKFAYMYDSQREVQWSGFRPWPGTLCCVLGQDTLLSRCLSPPRCIMGTSENA